MPIARPHFSLFELLPPIGLISIADVGAFPLDDAEDIYVPLVRAKRARVIGFEPAEGACAKLSDRMGPPHRFLPHIIGDGGSAHFHLTAAPMCSSLYPPNTALLEKFSDLAPLLAVKSIQPVQTVRLDDAIPDERVDFLKLDVQGAELDVLKGAPRILKDVLAIHTEVEFAPIYKGQPLFAEVDQFLRAAGFQFHSFTGMAGRLLTPITSLGGEGMPFRQHLWSEAVYTRDLLSLEKLDLTQLIILAVLMHDLYGAVDLAAHLLMLLQRRGFAVRVEEYLARLNRQK